ncbi:MAG: MFS transporter [Corynebacterium sp.]|nr:MFS transporter [Corynebacterium sp.]
MGLSQIRGLGATYITLIAAFGAWTLLLPVIPLAVVQQGGSATLAGLHTGVFMGATVLTQWLMPHALRRFGYVPIMVASALFLGLPALFYFHSLSLLIALVRGFGFGGLTVASSALVAELVRDSKLLGRALGLSGLCIGGSQVVTLLIGLWLPFSVVIWLVAIIGVVAAYFALHIPRIKPQEAEKTRLLPFTVDALVPAAAMCFIAMGFGALSSFLASALAQNETAGQATAGVLLSLLTVASMGARFIAGHHPRTFFIPALFLAGIGLVIISVALSLNLNLLPVIIGVLFFGAGFGVVQNEALLLLFDRCPKPEASSIWNMSFDGGTGIGSLVLGYFVPFFAYTGAYGAAAFMAFIAAVIVLMDQTNRRRGGAIESTIETDIE